MEITIGQIDFKFYTQAKGPVEQAFRKARAVEGSEYFKKIYNEILNGNI